jgi:CRP-like cAMP-binding protein
MATCVNSATATNLIPFRPVRDEAGRNNSQRGLFQRAQRGDEQAFRNMAGLKSLKTSVDPETLLASAGVGKRVVHLKEKDAAFSQGDAASAVFYIQKGKVRLTVVSKVGKEATLGILGKGEFFGEGCLAPQSLRIESATAMTDCELLRIDKKEMMLALQREPALLDLFVAYLVARNIRYQEDLIDHLFNSSEKRLARILLLLARFGEEGVPRIVTPMITQETLAGMIGTTRSRVSHFLNRFRKLGFLDYEDGSGIRVHSSLLNVVLGDQLASSTPAKHPYLM